MSIKKFIKFKNKHYIFIYLIFIIFLAFLLRIFNISWDEGFYFHPDERAIVMQTIPLAFPNNIYEFFSPNSPLNPHFFAYGSFPIYLLKLLSEIFKNIYFPLSMYSGMYVLGRLISAVIDTSTIIIIFILGKILFSKKTALFSALLYTFFVLPIQTSHFYVVDPILTFFMTAALLSFIVLYQKPTYNKAVIAGLIFGFATATKISALLMFPVIVLIFIFLLLKHKKTFGLLKTLFSFILVLLSSSFVFIITQPYVIIDSPNFIQQTLIQSQMSKNPFIFPYTLQYVGKTPYTYELKNIFFWGIGPFISIICLLGIIIFLIKLIKRKLKNLSINFIIFFYLLSYFLIVGSFAVGWMRYMLPIYPLFAIFGGWVIGDFVIEKIPAKYLKIYSLRKTLLLFLLILIIIYPLSFMNIYTKKNTRLQATDWILNNIPPGSSLALEHWDDPIPSIGLEKYKALTLPLYDQDTPEKWIQINQTLNQTDYIIIASNRLYVPLQKMAMCNKLPPMHCYPYTAKYYKNLFSGKLNFIKVAEFETNPKIPILNININDQSADESFTVYDHPKIMIFKKK